MKRAHCSLAFVLAVMPWACSSNDDTSPETDAGDASHVGPDGGASDTGGDATLDAGADVTTDAEADASDAGAADALLSCADPSSTPTSVSGDIVSDRALTCDKIYMFTGLITVQAPATLTIQRGTTILMGSGASVVVAPGAKLSAIGAREQPIVFTSAKAVGSRAPGDWGSIALVGKAPGNWGANAAGTAAVTMHKPDANPWPVTCDASDGCFPFQAGSDPPANYTDSSGAVVYVRMEYGGSVRIGAAAAADHELLGLYGVGNGTTIDYVEMRQGNYGCFFAEGGTFDAKHLICQHGGNTAFGLSRGGKNRVQFVIDQENPTKAAEGLGIKGPRDSNQLSPVTEPTVYNVTVCGTHGSTLTAKDPYGLFLKREPAGHVFNMIASGFGSGMSMRNGTNTATQPGDAPTTTEFRSSILFGNFDPTFDGGASCPAGGGSDPATCTNIAYGSPPDEIDLIPWFLNHDGTNSWKNSAANPGLYAQRLDDAGADAGTTDCFDPNVFAMAPGSAITNNATTPPNDGFFDSTAAYVGALRDHSDTWASGAWVVWSDK